MLFPTDENANGYHGPQQSSSSAPSNTGRPSGRAAADAHFALLYNPQASRQWRGGEQRQDFTQQRQLVGTGLLFEAQHNEAWGLFGRVLSDIGQVEISGDQHAAFPLADRYDLRVGRAGKLLLINCYGVVSGPGQQGRGFDGKVLVELESHTTASAKGKISS